MTAPDFPVPAPSVGPTTVLTIEQERSIDRLAEHPDGPGKHAAFMRCVLGERSYFEIALMSQAVKDEPLTAAQMRYIAAHWNDPEDSA